MSLLFAYTQGRFSNDAAHLDLGTIASLYGLVMGLRYGMLLFIFCIVKCSVTFH